MDQKTDPIGFYDVRDIIGDRKRGIQGIFPMSLASWNEGVRDGRFPQPIKMPLRNEPKKRYWLKSDILQLIERTKREAGK